MLVKIVDTVVATNMAGQVVESIPVQVADGPVQDASGQWVDPVDLVEDDRGVPVRIVEAGRVQNSVGDWVDAMAAVGAGVPVIGGIATGTPGEAGTIYEGYALADGDDFDTTTSAAVFRPGNNAGTYMTTRHYGVQSAAPRGLRYAASLGGYEADPWHTGFLDANRGVAVADYADLIEIGDGALKTKTRRATAAEKTAMGSIAKNNVSSMVHMGRRNMMRAPCLLEMRLRFPYALESWSTYHPTFWLIQSQPGNGFDGLEIDCEGFAPALEFHRNGWVNGNVIFASDSGTTAAVSKTEYRTYAFKIAEADGVWMAYMYEDGVLRASNPCSFGAFVFDPTRPFHLMQTSHILQSGINQTVFDNAGTEGAVMDCDWWRCWMPAAATFRKPRVGHVDLLADFDADFSFDLGTASTVWGGGASGDVLETIPNEDNSPNQPWQRALLPAGMSFNGSVFAGKVSNQPGRQVFARSYTPAAGDGCVPQPITLCIGPRIKTSLVSGAVGTPFVWDVYADCDCGDLHLNKEIELTGLPAGATFDEEAGTVSFSAAAAGSGNIGVTVTNSMGQEATKSVPYNIADATMDDFAHNAWNTLVADYDASRDSLFGSESGAQTSWLNGKVGFGNLGVPSGVTQATNRVSAQQNGLDVMRFTRGGGSATNSVMEALASTDVAQALAGTNKDFTLIAVFKTGSATTGFVAGWSQTVSGTVANQCGIVRRSGTASSVRYGPDNVGGSDVNIGVLANSTTHIIAWKHAAGVSDVWVNSLTKVVTATAQAPGQTFAPSFSIGSMHTNSGNTPTWPTTGFGGDVDEVLAASSARSDAEIVQAITDLAGKWGLTLV